MTVSAASPPSESKSHSDQLSSSRPASTSRWISQERGAIFEYQGQCVSLEWQSKQARRASSLVTDESHGGSARHRGIVVIAAKWDELSEHDEQKKPGQRPHQEPLHESSFCLLGSHVVSIGRSCWLRHPATRGDGPRRLLHNLGRSALIQAEVTPNAVEMCRAGSRNGRSTMEEQWDRSHWSQRRKRSGRRLP
jgi:hypothetical protein